MDVAIPVAEASRWWTGAEGVVFGAMLVALVGVVVGWIHHIRDCRFRSKEMKVLSESVARLEVKVDVLLKQKE